MPSFARPLTAVLTFLSVLLGTLGPPPRACEMVAGGGTAAASRMTAVMSLAAPAHDAAADESHHVPCAGDPQGAPARAPAGEQHGMPPAGDCGAVAHCVTCPTAPAVVVISRVSPLVSTPRAAPDALVPLGPDAEPEFPPPRA